jgi:hypothetical protein
MSNHHLLADEVHKTFFDCEKYLLPPAARVEQPFETFWRAANDGYDPPDKTNRYALAEPEARQLYDFLVSAGWRVRGVCLDDDMYDDIYLDGGSTEWKRVGGLCE